MRCPVHFCTGEEAVPASLYKILNKEDYLFSHHRSHGYFLAKKSPMKKLFAELYGKETDVLWSVVFARVDRITRHPSQIYEALLEGLILFFIMLLLIKKNFPVIPK